MSSIATDIVAQERARARQMARRLLDTHPIHAQARKNHSWCYECLQRLHRQSFGDEMDLVYNTYRKSRDLVKAHDKCMSKASYQLQCITLACEDFEEDVQDSVSSSPDHTTGQGPDVEHNFTILELVIKNIEDLGGQGLVIEEEVNDHKALEKRIGVDQTKAFLSGLGKVSEQEVEKEARCAICLDLFLESTFPENEIVRLPCDIKHVFHLTCISPWFYKKNICPFDRSVVFHSIMDKLR